MSRRKIFEGFRRRPVGRRRLLLAADVLEERTLLSTLFASLPEPVGVTTAFYGEVFVSYNSGTSSSPRESIAAYGSSGYLISLAAMTKNGRPGPLVTLGSSESLPTLDTGDILELQPDGQLFAFRPSTIKSELYSDFQGNPFNATSVYDSQTKATINLNSTISLTGASFGDFGIDGNNLVVSVESNGWDFVMQTSYSENNGQISYSTWDVVVAAPTSDGSTAPKGLAVNSVGTVLTTLPDAAKSDVLVSYNDRRPSGGVVIPNLGLLATPTIDARGITLDGSGNYVLAADATSLLNNGDPAYVAISPSLNAYAAHQIAPLPNSTTVPIPWGIDAPTIGTVIATVPSGKEVIYDSGGDASQYGLTSGYKPTQIRHAYGVDQITFKGPGGKTIQGDGAGQTIAIFGEGNDPTMLPDLQQFDRTFNLPDPPSFLQINNLKVGVDPYTIGETSLDVEWAHAIAPAANILLFDFGVSGNSATHFTSLMSEIMYMRSSYPTVSVVSISYGAGELALSQQGYNQKNFDADFQAPGVTFLVASGDNGAYGDYRNNNDPTVEVDDPAASPDVVAVGGTSLQNLDAAGDYPGIGANGEIGWGNGTNSGSGGGGGGISKIEPEPNWQKQVVPTSIHPTGGRAVPDVAWDSDPNTGFPLYYSTPDGSGDFGWEVSGGTSIATPQWAGLIAIADQERVQGDGGTPLTGYDQTLPALYSLPSSDYHDIVSGNNGYQAGPGYDLVTGRGSPVANLLVPALAAYKSQLVVTAQPPNSVTAGQGFGLTIKVEDGFGDVVTSYNGSVTISLGSNPSGGTLGGTLTVTAVDGIATFSGLTLNKVGSGYTLKASGGSFTTTATTSGIAVTPAAATHLVVTTEPPSSVTAGTSFGLKITAEDAYGNVAASFTGSVAIALSSNPGGSTLGGTLTAKASAGVASFSGLTLNKVGSGYTLKVSSGSLTTTATTSGIAVTPAAATHLVVTTEPPSNVAAGVKFGLAVKVEDAYGNIVTGFIGSVAVALANNPAGSTLGGTLSVTVVNGIATFTNLTLNKNNDPT